MRCDWSSDVCSSDLEWLGLKVEPWGTPNRDHPLHWQCLINEQVQSRCNELLCAWYWAGSWEHKEEQGTRYQPWPGVASASCGHPAGHWCSWIVLKERCHLHRQLLFVQQTTGKQKPYRRWSWSLLLWNLHSDGRVRQEEQVNKVIINSGECPEGNR